MDTKPHIFKVAGIWHCMSIQKGEYTWGITVSEACYKYVNRIDVRVVKQ